MSIKKDIFEKLNYELVRVIAVGGMGTVYEAVQYGTENFKKTVAIKIILEKYSAIKEFRSNFIGEARLVADLIHTNIVQTYHLGSYKGQYFMVMEYVNGMNLEDFLFRHQYIKQHIPVDLATFVISRICRGLAYAHQKDDEEGRLLGIVHRDVNPKNIMLTTEGNVKLTDFGIAKAKDLMYNKEGEVIAGKDEYLSPEQANKEVTDSRADIFSCGVILAELLLSYNIFEGSTGAETRNNILKGEIPNFSALDDRVDETLNAILQRALMRSREKRYQSAAEMMLALEMYLYKDGYGPTNEKLAEYIDDIYGMGHGGAPKRWQQNVQKNVTYPGLLL